MFKLPITHIMFSKCSDAAFLVTPISNKNGLKKGLLYELVAVNTKGQVALYPDGSLKQVEGPQGHWHDLTNLAWARSADNEPILSLGTTDPRADNQNELDRMRNEGGTHE